MDGDPCICHMELLCSFRFKRNIRGFLSFMKISRQGKGSKLLELSAEK